MKSAELSLNERQSDISSDLAGDGAVRLEWMYVSRVWTNGMA